METEIRISGMMCPHCEARVKEALENVSGVKAVSVSFRDGNAYVTGNAERIELENAVRAAGYEVRQ